MLYALHISMTQTSNFGFENVDPLRREQQSHRDTTIPTVLTTNIPDHPR